ncbi:MAG: hypothetical protein ABI602_01450 [Candidatus Saccharibacteria bacterium]
MDRPQHRTFYLTLAGVVGANYLAQVPYYFHQYYAPHKFLPSLVGSVLLLSTLAWFVAGYQLLKNGHRRGYWLMLTFLSVEFLFYLQTQISQALLSHQLLLHVYHPDSGLLLIVFAIGYLNFGAALYFIGYLVHHRRSFLSLK